MRICRTLAAVVAVLAISGGACDRYRSNPPPVPAEHGGPAAPNVWPTPE
jgi:hypothetical protein